MKLSSRSLALLTAAFVVAAPAFAQEKVKQEGVITAVNGDHLKVTTRQGPIEVVLTPQTEIKEISGAAGLQKKTREPKTLIPGLIIKAEGTQSGTTLTAEDIDFKERDWRSAIAAKGGTTEEFNKAAAERAELRKAIIEGQEYVIQQEATVYFAVGSSVVSAQHKAELRALAGKASSYGNYRISILGFADPTGNAEANEALSQKRAMAVSNYLRQTGLIQPGRVLSPSAMGEGTAAPGESMPNSNDKARRVVVRIVTPKGQLTQ